MRNRQLTEVIAALVTLAAAAAILLSTWEFRPRVDSKLHAAIGLALARETLALLGSDGQVVVITRDTSVFKQPAADVLVGALTRQLKRTHETEISTHLIQVDPLRPAQVPPGDFFELIRKAPAGSVIVSVMGPPLLTEEQSVQLGAIKTKIVALCSGNLGDPAVLRRLFERQLLHAAVVSRRDSPGAIPHSTPPPRSFDQLYATITPANVASLSAPSDTPSQDKHR